MAVRFWFSGRLGAAASSLGLSLGASYGDGYSGGPEHGHKASRATWLTSDAAWEVRWKGGALAKIYGGAKRVITGSCAYEGGAPTNCQGYKRLTWVPYVGLGLGYAF